MSTVLLQSTPQPSVDSQSIEPITLRLKLAFPPPTPQNLQMGFWNSIEIPELSSPISYSPDPSSFRIPPCPSSPNSSSSCSSSAMSDRSLDLCTEDLGNETGCTDIADADLFSSVLPSDNYEDFPKRFAPSKRAGPRNFPPPLTTMSSGESINFRQHRRDGRLVIEAVRAPPAWCGLQAERSNGRVRLGYLTRTDSMSDLEPFDFQETAQEQEEEVEGDCPCEEEEEEEMDIEGEEEEDVDCSGRGVDEKNEKFGVRMENVEIYARTGRRCTEGGKSGLWGFGTFLVATS